MAGPKTQYQNVDPQELVGHEIVSVRVSDDCGTLFHVILELEDGREVYFSTSSVMFDQYSSTPCIKVVEPVKLSDKERVYEWLKLQDKPRRIKTLHYLTGLNDAEIRKHLVELQIEKKVNKTASGSWEVV